MRRSGCCSRSNSTLQVDLPAGGDEDGFYGQLSAEAGGGSERQRDAHERFGQQRRQESFLGSERRRKTEQIRVGVRGSDTYAWERYLFAAERECECISPARSAL